MSAPVFVVATATCRELHRESAPVLWRKVRRFNRPVQLAVAACDEVACHASDPTTAALVALAPCQSGSPELYASAMRLAARAPDDDTPFRVNPVHTLHAVDNLALSTVSIELANRAFGLGLGGAAGQAWEGLDVVRERFDAGLEGEALLFGGDQESSEAGGDALGAAGLLSRAPRRLAGTGSLVRIAGVEWHADGAATAERPHAVRALGAFFAALASLEAGPFRYAIQDDVCVTLYGDVVAESDTAGSAACAG